MTTPAEFEKKLSVYRKLINSQIKLALSKQNPPLLYDPMRYTLLAGGKRLRPLLIMLTCEAVNGDYKETIDAAVAIELLHSFTLIHDDVMDQDDTRRGQPTVHKKWDVDTAILSGDGLVALSYEYLLRTKFEAIDCLGLLFSKALLEVCEGQALDKKFETANDVSISEYFTMIEKKTAALIAVCCELGGYIGGAKQNVISNLRKFGLNLGLAFQIQDDLLDIIAEEKHLGKTWGSDIKRKKKTLLLIQAKKLADSQNFARIEAIMNKNELNRNDVFEMKEIFQKTGTIDYSQNLLENHFQKARENLKVLDSIQGKNLLENFLETILQRTY
jgi:geranylgeranyl pyrophosphate synthase